METCAFIPASELNLSIEGWENISNSSNITFGDANRTLYTLERLRIDVEFENENDKAILNAAIDKYGLMFYIDLEN